MAADHLIKHLEARVEECQRQIARFKSELATFQAALQLERSKRVPRKKHGRGTTPKRSITAPRLPLTPIDNDGNAENKTDLLRRFIRDNPGQLKQAVMAFGNKHIPGANANFGYTAIYKMGLRGEIEIKEGRVNPTPKLKEKLEAAEAASRPFSF